MDHTKAVTLETINAISMLRTLNIHLKENGDNYAEMEVTVDDRHKNYLGGGHGGLIATLIDTVAFFPKTLLPSRKPCTTTNLTVTYVRPAALGDVLTARSEVMHLGRKLVSLAVTVKNQKDKLVAHGTVTLMISS